MTTDSSLTSIEPAHLYNTRSSNRPLLPGVDSTSRVRGLRRLSGLGDIADLPSGRNGKQAQPRRSPKPKRNDELMRSRAGWTAHNRKMQRSDKPNLKKHAPQSRKENKKAKSSAQKQHGEDDIPLTPGEDASVSQEGGKDRSARTQPSHQKVLLLKLVFAFVLAVVGSVGVKIRKGRMQHSRPEKNDLIGNVSCTEADQFVISGDDPTSRIPQDDPLSYLIFLTCCSRLMEWWGLRSKSAVTYSDGFHDLTEDLQDAAFVDLESISLLEGDPLSSVGANMSNARNTLEHDMGFNNTSANISSRPTKPTVILGMDYGTTKASFGVHSHFLQGLPKKSARLQGVRLHSSVDTCVTYDLRTQGDIKIRKRCIPEDFPTSTIFGIKRFHGCDFEDDRLRKYVSWLPFQVQRCEEFNHRKCCVTLQGEHFKEQVAFGDVISKFWEHMRHQIRKDIGVDAFYGLVVGVPASFSGIELQEVKTAATEAGVDINLLVLDTVATLAARLSKTGRHMDARSTMLVLDWGGGTLDVLVARQEGHSIEVLGVDGDRWLGGLDLDVELTRHVKRQEEKRVGFPIELSSESEVRLLGKVERLKVGISRADATQDLHVRSLYYHPGTEEMEHLSQEVELEVFDQIIWPFVKRTMETVARVINKAGITPQKVTEIILAGQSSNLPLLYKSIKSMFPNAEVHDQETHSVAEGAAYLAHAIRCCPVQYSMPVLGKKENMPGHGVDKLGRKKTSVLRGSEILADRLSTSDQAQPQCSIPVKSVCSLLDWQKQFWEESV